MPGRVDQFARKGVHNRLKVAKMNTCCGPKRMARQRLASSSRTTMTRHRDKAGALKGAVEHLLKVTRSYWPGLLPCYRVPDLPRTNNDLEHLFGSQRHHERRATGRKGASPGLVLRGPVRLLAATVTRLRPVEPCDLAPRDQQSWCRLRDSLESRRHSRTLRTRFRRDPEAYLRDLEHQLGQLTLPA
jgi:hypothetical protein